MVRFRVVTEESELVQVDAKIQMDGDVLALHLNGIRVLFISEKEGSLYIPGLDRVEADLLSKVGLRLINDTHIETYVHGDNTGR